MKMASENEIGRRREASVKWLAQIYRAPGPTSQKDEVPQSSEDKENTRNKLRHEISKAKLDYLFMCAGDPFLPVTVRDKKLNVTIGRGSALRKALEEKGLIKMHRIQTGRRGGQIRLAEMTDKGYVMLAKYEVHVKKPAGRGSYEHRWWQRVVHDFFEKRGFRARIEQEIAGKAVDVGVIYDGRNVAIEVVNEGIGKELANVAKDLEAGWDEVWLCAVKKETLERLQGKVLEAFGRGLLESGRVRLKKLSEFLPEKAGEQGSSARERE